MLSLSALRAELQQAVKGFWTTRALQGTAQGSRTGSKDAGARSMVTGGKQMDGFISLFAGIIQSDPFQKQGYRD